MINKSMNAKVKKPRAKKSVANKQTIKKPLIKNLWIRNILSILAVPFFGYILLILTFILDAIYQGSIRWVAGLFMDLGPESTAYLFPPFMHLSFVVIIGLISWFVFRSKLKDIYKAIYMTVPVAVVFVTFGMFLYPWPWAVFLTGGIFCAGAFYYLYRAKQPWIFYYALILVALVLSIFTLMGGEI